MKQRASASSAKYTPGFVPYTKPPTKKSSGPFGLVKKLFSSSEASTGAVRDFAFETKGGVVFFSRSKDALAPFGFKHAQRLQYGSQHYQSGTVTTVIGVHGGHLYVFDDDQKIAQPLQGINHEELMDRYGFSVLDGESMALKPADIPSDWSVEEISFLQTSPDVILKIGDCGTDVHLVPKVLNGYFGWAGESHIVLNGQGLKDVPAQAVASMLINPNVEADADGSDSDSDPE